MTGSQRRGTDPPRDDVAETFGDLAALLWREREILEDLLFRLVEQQLILSAGGARWLPKADHEVRAVAETLQEHEIVRAAEVNELVRHYALPGDTSLRELAAFAPEPWPLVLLEHREALRLLALEIDQATDENRRLLLSGAYGAACVASETR
jgi:hypothetical protein